MKLSEKISNRILEVIGIINKRLVTKPFIVCYHSIANNSWRFSTPEGDFTKQIIFLNANIGVIPLSKLVNNTTSQHKCVAITFDDGYEDIYKNAFPALKNLGLTATVFVVGEADNVNRSEIDNNKKLLSLSQIRELKKNGWDIGFHSATHQDPRSLDNEQLVKEIVTGKKDLESKLGFPIDYYAYPRGIYSDSIVETVKKAGFKAAFTVDAGSASAANRMLISRIPLEGKMTMNQFKALFTTIGIEYFKTYIKTLQVKESLTRFI